MEAERSHSEAGLLVDDLPPTLGYAKDGAPAPIPQLKAQTHGKLHRARCIDAVAIGVGSLRHAAKG